MTAAASTKRLSHFKRFLLAGLVTGVVDGLFSSVLSVAFYDSSVTRLFQGVAGVLIGAQPAMDGGIPTALLGLLMHFGVAFAWSILFVTVVLRLAWVRDLAASKYGVLKVAALYGPLIWSFMSLVVIPLLIQRPPSITPRWWIQFFGHIPFVGLPIVAMAIQDPDRRR
jgi:uncharacterized membrane protein YagU involved in acid resistance